LRLYSSISRLAPGLVRTDIDFDRSEKQSSTSDTDTSAPLLYLKASSKAFSPPLDAAAFDALSLKAHHNASCSHDDAQGNRATYPSPPGNMSHPSKVDQPLALTSHVPRRKVVALVCITFPPSRPTTNRKTNTRSAGLCRWR
jgi:hypothetical protein